MKDTKRRVYMAVVAMVAVLSVPACDVLKENAGGLTGGASAIATAPAVRDAVVQWLDGDEIATQSLEPVGAFFKTGYDVLTGQPDMPILELVSASPEYVDNIPVNWDAMLAAFDEYEARSGNARPALVSQFIINGEIAYTSAKSAIDLNDKVQNACKLYSAAAPIAAMFSPIPLPSKIPGCS